jgi:protein O-GlcNAc transferase
MKYLSFSLWGNNPIYNVGAIKNAELSKVLYYDWKMVVYHDNTVPNETLSKLKDLDITLINVT